MRKVRPVILHLTPLVYWRVIVLYQCSLEQDLALFEAGDATEVGEKGITLRYCFAQLSCGRPCQFSLCVHYTVEARR